MPMYMQTRDGLKETMSVRKWREANKSAYYAVGMEFEDNIKPMKFQAGAASTYSFQARSPKYLKRKSSGYTTGRSGQRYPIPHGGTRDLVLTGRLQASIMRRHFPRVYPTRVTIRYTTPLSDRGHDYAGQRPRSTKHPNLSQELLSVTPQQFRRLESIYHDTIEEFVKK